MKAEQVQSYIGNSVQETNTLDVSLILQLLLSFLFGYVPATFNNIVITNRVYKRTK